MFPTFIRAYGLTLLVVRGRFRPKTPILLVSGRTFSLKTGARVLDLGLTTSKAPPYRSSQHYRVVILHCSLFKSDLTIFVDLLWHFKHRGMPSFFFAFVCFSVITMIHFEPALLPSVVYYFSAARKNVRLCGFGSTFHYDGLDHVLFPSLYALGGNIRASCVVSVFVRHWFFPCCRRPCILAYLFYKVFLAH